MFGFTKKLTINATKPPAFIKTALINNPVIVDNFIIRCGTDGTTAYAERMDVVFEHQGSIKGIPYYLADFTFSEDTGDANERCN